ncbi:MAG: hypothetical protein KJS70_02585 [Actinomycetales bacterium]|nr:hypothetical protein [Actinomycetales bacterium]
MSSSFLALIWWVLPALGLSGALLYVLWVTKFEGKFQQETQRSVGQFQRFQDSLRESQARDVAADSPQSGLAAMSGHSGNNHTQVIKPDSEDDSLDDNPFLKKS